MNGNEKKIKKIPIVTYLCYLLVVSVLFTGVTFSRYTVSKSGDVSTDVLPFAASYEIDNISSTSYTNADFWLQSDQAQGTPRTVRFTVRNYREDESNQNKIGITSGVDLNATLRLYMPAELADNLVLQVEEVNGNDQTAITPQYIIGNLVYALEKNDENEYEYKYENEAKIFADYSSGDAVLETQYFKDYQALPEAEDETLTMSGGFDAGGEGHISAVAQSSGNSITITSTIQTAEYSVGFQRGKDENEFRTQLFLDLEKEIPFYAIDINLGEKSLLTGGTSQTRTFILYITLADRIINDDYGAKWDDESSGDDESSDKDKWLTAPTSRTAVYEFNGAVVTGYHFDMDAETYNGTERGLEKAEKSTKIRIRKEYERNGEQYTGTVKTSYWHVAPISEDTTFNYIHPIENMYTYNSADTTLTKYEFNSEPLGGKEWETDSDLGVFGLCSNAYGNIVGADGNGDSLSVTGLDGYSLISFKNLADSPFYKDYESQNNPEHDYNLFSSLSKSYATEMTVLFVQASDGAKGGETA